MDRRQLYVERVREVCSDLSIERASLAIGLQNNDVLVVNDELVFRFPKHDEGVTRLKVEAAILTGVQGYFSAVKVPDPIYMSLSPRVGQAFIGYRMIQGEIATNDDFKSFDSEKTGEAVASQLATFLKELHAVPVDSAVAVDLPVIDSYSEWLDMYARTRENLFHHMRPDAQKRIADHFEAFLMDGTNFEREPALRHGDFGTGNIVVDRSSWAINGIIDFGSAGLGDPAVDVAWIHYRSGVGQSFLKSFYSAYPEIETALGRARFYAGTFALQEALFGFQNAAAGAFRRGIAEYV